MLCHQAIVMIRQIIKPVASSSVNIQQDYGEEQQCLTTNCLGPVIINESIRRAVQLNVTVF